MFKKKIVGFIGAGNMAEAMIKGFISSKILNPARIVASDVKKDRLLHLAETYEIKIYNKNEEVAVISDVIMLAVKPQDLNAALLEIAPYVTREKLICSIVAGKTIETIIKGLYKGGLKGYIPVIRVMPNTPTLVGCGAAGFYAGDGVDKDDLKFVKTLFASVAAVIEVKDESLMDSVTGLSGSGPAYVFFFMSALVEAGVKEGLSPDEARELVLITTLGSAKLAIESKKELSDLINMVASPGGTTIEGLKELESHGFKELIQGAVHAAVKRAKELSGTD